MDLRYRRPRIDYGELGGDQMTRIALSLILILAPLCNLKAQGIPFLSNGMVHAAGGAAPAYVQQQTYQVVDSTATNALTLSVTIPAGDLAVCLGTASSSTQWATAVTDSHSNTWTVSNDGAGRWLAYSLLGTTDAGGDTITFTWATGNFTAKNCLLLDFSGSFSTVDNTAIWTASFGTTPHASVTTTNAKDLIVAMVLDIDNKTYTLGGSYTAAGAVYSDFGSAKINGVYRVVSSTGTYDPAGSLTANGSWASGTFSFKYN